MNEAKLAGTLAIPKPKLEVITEREKAIRLSQRNFLTNVRK